MQPMIVRTAARLFRLEAKKKAPIRSRTGNGYSISPKTPKKNPLKAAPKDPPNPRLPRNSKTDSASTIHRLISMAVLMLCPASFGESFSSSGAFLLLFFLLVVLFLAEEDAVEAFFLRPAFVCAPDFLVFDFAVWFFFSAIQLP